MLRPNIHPEMPSHGSRGWSTIGGNPQGAADACKQRSSYPIDFAAVMEADSELGGGTNLFWRSCPVLVRRGERGDERTAELTIRLIATGHKQGQRVRLAAKLAWAVDQPLTCSAWLCLPFA